MEPFITYAAPGTPDPPSGLAPTPRTRTKGTGERVLTATLAGGVGYGWPGGWSQDRREQARHFKFWTYVAVTCIMDECARYVPHLGYVSPRDHKGGWREKTYRERRFLKTMHHVKPHEDVEMVEPDHPLLRIFERPNAWDTAGLPDLIKEWVMFQCLHGNGYWWTIPHLMTGLPEELFILPSHWVWARYNRNTPTGLEHYEIRPFIGPGQFVIPPEELIHTREKNPLHKIDGYSPQQAIDHWVDELESAHRARFWQFRNQTGLSGAIELPADYHDPDDQELERIYAKIFSRLQGESNYGRPAVLGPGMKFVPLKVTPLESDFKATVEQLRDSVLAAWRVPKEVAGVQPSGGDLSWYAPLQQFVRNNIAPRLSYLGHVLTHSLCKRYDPNLRLWWDDPTPDNPEQVNRDLQVNKDIGAQTINEVRAIRGLEPSDEPNADKLLVPSGSVLLEKVGEEQEQAQNHNIHFPGGMPGGGGGEGARPFGKQHERNGRGKREHFRKNLTEATPLADDDPEEFAEMAADILYGIFGDDALDFLRGGKAKKWDANQHPRGPDGRFIKRGSSDAARAAHEAVSRAIKGEKSAASVADVMNHLQLLTVKQIRAIYKEHGAKAPKGLRQDLVDTIVASIEATQGRQAQTQDQPDEAARPDRTGGRGASGADAGARGPVAGEAGQAGGEEANQGREPGGQSARARAAARVPASHEEVNRRLDRFEKFFAAKGQHHVSEWLGKLREHINATGGQAALDALGPPAGASDKEVQYWGVGTEEANWKHMGEFMESYLARNGITAVTAETSEPDSPLISALAKPDRYVAGQDFKPVNDAFRDKLEESQNLPGLEKSEDLGKVMGKPVTHLTADVTAKLDEEYGKGQWIVKCYGDDAAAGFGIFFPQRAEKIAQEARNTVWESGGHLARYGFSHLRDDSGKVVGIKHTGGDEYKFGTEKYEKTIQGDARHWADRAAAATESEKGAILPNGGKEFMVQPAFPVVGISEEERARGVTWREDTEARVHLVTRADGSVEVVPHATWPKGANLPVVFETEHTRAMAKAAQEAISKLPAKARAGQVYAPDVIKTKDGYKIVELNAQGDYNGSGYLHDNHFTIDAYTSHLVGREPMHVAFIRQLLTRRKAQEKKWRGAKRWHFRKNGFREEDHPRDESGEFTSGGGGAATATRPKKPVTEVSADKEEADPRVGTFATAAEHQAIVERARAKLVTLPEPSEKELAEAQEGIERLGANKYRKNLIGNTGDRRKRREKLLDEFGDGKVCPCIYCARIVSHGTLEQDKIRTTAQGGRYRMPNLVPSCSDCNKRRSDMPFEEALEKAVKYGGHKASKGWY